MGAKAATDPNRHTFKRWFAAEPLSDIKAVFAKMSDGQILTTNVASMVLDRMELSNKGPSHPRVVAYTISGTGRFHICVYGLRRPLLTDISFRTLDDRCSLIMRTLSMTVLHELREGIQQGTYTDR